MPINKIMSYAKYPFLVIPYLMRNPKSFPHFREDKYFNGFPFSPVWAPVGAWPRQDWQAVARNEVKLPILHIS